MSGTSSAFFANLRVAVAVSFGSVPVVAAAVGAVPLSAALAFARVSNKCRFVL